jgi:hypothetical protein
MLTSAFNHHGRTKGDNHHGASKKKSKNIQSMLSKHMFSHFKPCAFRYQISQNMCFDITFCTGSGRRTTVLKFIKNSYGVVTSPVAGGENPLIQNAYLHDFRREK